MRLFFLSLCASLLFLIPTIVRGSHHHGMSGHGEVRGGCEGHSRGDPESSRLRVSPRPGLHEVHPRVCAENQTRWRNKSVFSCRERAHSVTVSQVLSSLSLRGAACGCTDKQRSGHEMSGVEDGRRLRHAVWSQPLRYFDWLKNRETLCKTTDLDSLYVLTNSTWRR